MPSLTTSYFAKSRKIKGTKISIAKFNHPNFMEKVDEIQNSFAPSIKLLRAYKNEEISWNWYRRKYKAEQEEHYVKASEDFENMLKRASIEDIVLLCYEKFEGRKTRCHRLILYSMLKKIAKEKGYDVNFIDEKHLP